MEGKKGALEAVTAGEIYLQVGRWAGFRGRSEASGRKPPGTGEGRLISLCIQQQEAKGFNAREQGIIRFSLLENSCCSLRGQNNMGRRVKRVSRGTKQAGSQGATGRPENRGHTGHPFWGRVTGTWGRIRVGCEVEGDVLGGGVLGPWGSVCARSHCDCRRENRTWDSSSSLEHHLHK